MGAGLLPGHVVRPAATRFGLRNCRLFLPCSARRVLGRQPEGPPLCRPRRERTGRPGRRCRLPCREDAVTSCILASLPLGESRGAKPLWSGIFLWQQIVDTGCDYGGCPSGRWPDAQPLAGSLPCSARRVLEQQPEEPPLCRPQQEHTGQPEQQCRLPCREHAPKPEFAGSRSHGARRVRPEPSMMISRRAARRRAGRERRRLAGRGRDGGASPLTPAATASAATHR